MAAMASLHAQRLLLLAATALPVKSIAQHVVSGIMFDSLRSDSSRVAVVVLLDGAARTTTTDARGKFEFGDVAPGRHLLQISHPWLDSPGISLPVTQVVVDSTDAVHSLFVPGVQSLSFVLCGAPTADRRR